MGLNWEDNGQREISTGKKKSQNGLETCIKNINSNFSWHKVDIPDGSDEKEIWDIFLKVFDVIKENDEIIFDITHAFRSIPLLAIIILNYAKIMKNASLTGIYYGAFEALGSIGDAKKLPVEKRIVPIIDLTAFDQLMEWSAAADRFVSAGNADQLSKISSRSARAILSQTRGQDRSQHTIRRLAENLDKFTGILSTCRGKEISIAVERLKQSIEDCKNLNFDKPLNRPLKTILGKIEGQVNKFKEHFIKDGIQAARWCMEHNMIQQSYTILQETLISYFVYKIGQDPENYENKNLNRTIANQAITIFLKGLPLKEWKKEAHENQHITDQFINFYKTQHELVKTYNNLTNYRNDLNHAGYSDSARHAEKFSKELPYFLNIAEKAIIL